MKTTSIVTTAAMLLFCGGCRRSSAPVAPAAPTVITGAAMSTPMFDRCQTAPLVAAPVTITGDLTTASADSNESIQVTGYTWAGRDHFVAMNLSAGQSVTLRLTEADGWDGGLYVFRDCNAIAATTVSGLDTNPTRPLQFTAPAAGRYIVAIDAWQPNTGGHYTLTVTSP